MLVRTTHKGKRKTGSHGNGAAAHTLRRSLLVGILEVGQVTASQIGIKKQYNHMLAEFADAAHSIAYR